MNIKRAFRVWQRNFTVYTKLYKSSIALNFIEPILYLIAFGIGLGGFIKNIDGMPYINFIAPGIIASSAMFAATYECTYSTFVKMEFQKTYDAILATPISMHDLILGELLWGATKSMFYGIIIIIALFFFGLINSFKIILIIPVLFLSGFLFSEFGLIAVAIVPGIDTFNFYYTLFMTPMVLFSGVYFPLNNMPQILTKIAFCSPLYHFVNICRECASGNLRNSIYDFIWILVVACVIAPLTFKLMQRRILLH